MAPTNSNAGDVAVSFSSSLISNLAPLITLFGDQVTKQFLSQVTGWTDTLVFAMAPAGILTGIVSAIRLGGSNSLKALIGRARENRAAVEKELLSTTSDSVCEMWTGSSVDLYFKVRMAGRPMTREFIYKPIYPDKKGNHTTKENKDPGPLFDLFTLWSCGVYTESSRVFTSIDERFDLAFQAPNLTINGPSHKTGSYPLAIVACLVQVAILIAAGVGTFRYRLLKPTRPFAPMVAYLLFSIGSCLITVGLALSCVIIKSAVRRHELHTQHQDYCVIRVQKAMRMGDEEFKSYAIFNKDTDNSIRLWRSTGDALLNEKSFYEKWTIVASTVTVTGFIAQFLGTLGLHYFVSVTLVVGSLILLVLRSWASLGLANGLNTKELLPGHELAHLTRHIIGRLDSWEVRTRRITHHQDVGAKWSRPCPDLDLRSCDGFEYRPRTIRSIQKHPEMIGTANDVIGSRMSAQNLVSSVVQPAEFKPIVQGSGVPKHDRDAWSASYARKTLAAPWPDDYAELSDKLNVAICRMWTFVHDKEGDHGFTLRKPSYTIFSFDVDILLSKLDDTESFYEADAVIYMHPNAKREWSMDVAKLSAILSLWHYEVDLKNRYSNPTRFYRLLGVFRTQEDYEQHHKRLYSQWVGSGLRGFSSKDEAGLDLEIHQDISHKHDLGTYPVFGFNLFTKEPEFYPTPPTSTTPAEEPSSSSTGLPPDDSSPRPFATGALTDPSTPLKTLLAQELLHNFLFTLAIHTQSLRNSSHITPAYLDSKDLENSPEFRRDTQSQFDPIFRHGGLEKLCQIVIESGLVTTLDEARMLVIPPFLMRGHLKLQPSVKNMFEREKEKQFEEGRTERRRMQQEEQDPMVDNDI